MADTRTPKVAQSQPSVRTPFNIIYTNNGIKTPSGGTDKQTVSGLSSLTAYLYPTQRLGAAPSAQDAYAASVIKSNGENIGNAKLKSNPLPPGITS